MSSPRSSTFASSNRLTASRASDLDGSSSYRFGPALDEASKISTPVSSSIGDSSQSAKRSSNNDLHSIVNTPSKVSKLHTVNLEDSSPNHGSNTLYADSSRRASLNSNFTDDLDQYDDAKLLEIQAKLQQELGGQKYPLPSVVGANVANSSTSRTFAVSSTAENKKPDNRARDSWIQPQAYTSRNMGIRDPDLGRGITSEQDSAALKASNSSLVGWRRDNRTAAVSGISKTNRSDAGQQTFFKRTEADDQSGRDMIAGQLANTKKFDEKRIAEEKRKALTAPDGKRKNLESSVEPAAVTQKPSPSISSKNSIPNDGKKSLFPKYVATGQPPKNAAQLFQANNTYENLPDSEILRNRGHEQNAEDPSFLGDTRPQSHLPSQTPRNAKDQAVKVVGRWSDVSGDAEEVSRPAVALDVAEANLARSLQAERQQKRHAELLSFDDEADLRAKKKKKAIGSVSDSPRSISTSIPQSQPSTNSSQHGLLGASLKGVRKASDTAHRRIPASFDDASNDDKILFCMRERGDDWKAIRGALEKETGRNLMNKSLRYRYVRMKSKSWEQPQDEEFLSNNNEEPAAIIGLPALVAKHRNRTIPESKKQKPRKGRDRREDHIRAREKRRIKKEQSGGERQATDNRSIGDVADEDEDIFFQPTGNASQDNASSDQKRQVRLDVEQAKRKAKHDEYEGIKAAMRRFHPEQGNDDLFVGGGEQANRAASVYESSTSSDEDEGGQYQSARYPPGPLATDGHAATATKTVSEATLPKLHHEDLEASQSLDEDADELQSGDDGEPETSYMYHVGRRVTLVECDDNPLGAPRGTSQSELGPFHTLAEANETAKINVRPTTTEAFLFSSGLKSINCDFDVAGFHAWTVTGEIGKIQTFVTREISTTSLPSTISFSIPQYLYLVLESSISTSTTPRNKTPQRYLTQPPADVFTTLDLANREAASRWFDHATEHLDVKKPLDDIRKVEMEMGLRKDVRVMNEDGVGFERDWKEGEGEGKVWVEVRMVKGPRN